MTKSPRPKTENLQGGITGKRYMQSPSLTMSTLNFALPVKTRNYSENGDDRYLHSYSICNVDVSSLYRK